MHDQCPNHSHSLVLPPHVEKLYQKNREELVEELATSLKAGSLQKEGLAERRVALEQKMAARVERRAQHGEKAAALALKLKPDPEAERKL